MVLRQLAQIRRSCENNPFFDTMFRAGIFATYAAITFGVVPSGPSNIIGGAEAAEAAVPVRYVWTCALPAYYKESLFYP